MFKKTRLGLAFGLLFLSQTAYAQSAEFLEQQRRKAARVHFDMAQIIAMDNKCPVLETHQRGLTYEYMSKSESAWNQVNPVGSEVHKLLQHRYGVFSKHACADIFNNTELRGMIDNMIFRSDVELAVWTDVKKSDCSMEGFAAISKHATEIKTKYIDQPYTATFNTMVAQRLQPLLKACGQWIPQNDAIVAIENFDLLEKAGPQAKSIAQFDRLIYGLRGSSHNFKTGNPLASFVILHSEGVPGTRRHNANVETGFTPDQRLVLHIIPALGGGADAKSIRSVTVIFGGKRWNLRENVILNGPETVSFLTASTYSLSAQASAELLALPDAATFQMEVEREVNGKLQISVIGERMGTAKATEFNIGDFKQALDYANATLR